MDQYKESIKQLEALESAHGGQDIKSPISDEYYNQIKQFI